MEKWKIVAGLVFMVAAALGYPAYQQKMESEAAQAAAQAASNHASATPASTKPSGPDANVLIQKFVGKPLPDWNIAAKYWMNTTKPLEPNDLKGHVAIVEFFRIQCSHCQQAAPVMRELYRRFGAQGLKIVGIQSPGDLNPQENDWDNVASVCKSQFGLDYPIAFDEKSKLFKTAYSGKLYPSVFILNRKGVVVFAQTGFNEEREKKFLTALQTEMNKK